MNNTLSAFGYPGGKVRSIRYIVPYFPTGFSEFREIFAGGASMSLQLMRRHPKAKFWINDLHYPVYCFWKMLRERPEDMSEYLLSAYDTFQKDLTGLYEACRTTIDSSNEFETACKFYIGQKLGFSGMGLDSTCSTRNVGKFTPRSIHSLFDISTLLKCRDVSITNLSYEQCLVPGENVLIFADPPYDIKRFLYGKKGSLHSGFSHLEFANTMRGCSNNWLITYNDNEQIRRMFADFNIFPWRVQYTMQNRNVGNELIITNYEKIKCGKQIEPHFPNRGCTRATLDTPYGLVN